jgi:hypothetical protein
MKWKPKEGERVWTIDFTLDVVYSFDYIAMYNCKEYRVGNVFRTKALALSALKKVRKVLKEARKG